MGRYLGPVEKLSRREGVDLGLKGARALAGKGALERRPYPPGEHGRGRVKNSEFATQLRGKQRAKRMYSLREGQFRRAFDHAGGTQLLRTLEMRLDNVVYRLGFASTRAQARQFVVHGHIRVNDKKIDRPSHPVRTDDTIALKAGSGVEPLVREATEQVGRVPDWLLADYDRLWGQMKHEPELDEIEAPVDQQLIIEFYSK
jgi:small subunit ribosomal protein S4